MADEVDLLQEREDDVDTDVGPALPAGIQNLVTREGYEAFQAELKKLQTVDRPETVKIVEWAASNGDRSENADYTLNKQKLRKIDSRIRFLMKRLESFKVVDVEEQRKRGLQKVYFGATVTYEELELETRGDPKRTVTIVGVDEADIDRARISWMSPLGRALFGAEADDEVEVKAPGGSRSVAVIKVVYGE